MNDDNRIVYEREDGKIVYRASSLGSCFKALVAARRGYDPTPPPDSLAEVYGAGHAAEAKLMATDRVITRQQEEVELAITSKISIIGHIDGVKQGPGRVVEVKSQSGKVYDEFKTWLDSPLWEKYAWQTSVYMNALNMELELIRVNRDSGKASSEIWQHPPYTLAQIRTRVLCVESMAADGDELPECAGKDWGCPFSYLHEQVELVDDVELDRLVDSYYYYKEKKEGDERGIKNAQVAIRARLDELGLSKALLPNGISISRSEFEVKEHLVKASKQSRLTITKPKGPNVPTSPHHPT